MNGKTQETRADVEYAILQPEPVEMTFGEDRIMISEAPWMVSLKVARKLFPVGRDILIVATRLITAARGNMGFTPSAIERELLVTITQEAPEAVSELIVGSCTVNGEPMTEEYLGKLPYHGALMLAEQAVNQNYSQNGQAREFFTRLAKNLPGTPPTNGDTS